MKIRENLAGAIANICCASAEVEKEDQKLVFARAAMLGHISGDDDDFEATLMGLKKIKEVMWFKSRSSPLRYSALFSTVVSAHMLATTLPISKLIEAEGGDDRSSPTLVRRCRVFTAKANMPDQKVLFGAMTLFLQVLRDKFSVDLEQVRAGIVEEEGEDRARSE